MHFGKENPHCIHYKTLKLKNQVKGFTFVYIPAYIFIGGWFYAEIYA